MTARVIDDPGALGWDYDTDTGRWTWGGGSAGGGGGGSFPEAPVDGKQYGRQNAGWTEIVSTGGGGGSAGPDPRISDTQIGNWDTSFSWGDHGEAGYLTSFTEADPTVPDHVKAITTSDIANWNSGTGGGGGGFSGDYNDLTNKPTIPTNNTQLANGMGYVTGSVVNGYATQSWVTSQSYATQGWVATNYVSIPTIASYYTKTEADAKFELKGAGGGGGAFVPLTGNSTINGTLTADDFIASSDERLKKNVCTAPTGVLDKIRGVEFEWKESGQMSSGVIAQELESVPELAHLVHSGEDDGTKHVSYLGLIGYLIEEVKALRDEIEAMK